MPVHVEWLDDARTIITYRLEDPVILDEIYTALDKGTAEILNQPHDIYVIFDFLEVTKVPPNLFSALSYMKKISKNNVTLRVAVGGSRMVSAFFNMILNSIPHIKNTVKTAQTIEEALNIIHTYKNHSESSPLDR